MSIKNTKKFDIKNQSTTEHSVNRILLENNLGFSLLRRFEPNTQTKSKKIYFLLQSVDLRAVLKKIFKSFVQTLNQISFCKYMLSEELTRIKVTDKYLMETQNQREEAKKRFFKIEEINHRELLNLLLLLSAKNHFIPDLQGYTKVDTLKKSCFGINFISKTFIKKVFLK